MPIDAKVWLPPAGRSSTDDRNARLASSLSGTNLIRAGDYNQRVVLQAIRVAGETTRSELAEVTGLTAPTIANITRRLLDAGLVLDAGRRHGSRGQPAVRLAIDPNGSFSIGVNVDRDHVTVVMLDLAGRVRNRTLTEVAFAMPDEVRRIVRAEIAGIVEEDPVAAGRICGIGVALPDGLAKVDLPHRPVDYGIWDDTDVAALLGDILPVAVHVDNDAAAAAIGELHFGHGMGERSFFYILVSAGLGGGLVLDGSYYRGAHGRSGEIGFLPAAGATLERTVSLSTLVDRIASTAPDPLPVHRLDEAGADVQAVIDGWIDDAAQALVEPIIAIDCLINPGAILIGGRLPDAIVDRLVEKIADAFAPHAARVPAPATIRRAMLSADGPAIGAAILPFNDLILPSQASLMKVA